MAIKKTVALTEAGVKKIPKNKPGVYEIKGSDTESKYVGMAQKGRLQDRVREHLPGSSKDPVKGGKIVTIKQTASKASAQKIEKAMIKSKQPPQNKNGK